MSTVAVIGIERVVRPRNFPSLIYESIRDLSCAGYIERSVIPRRIAKKAVRSAAGVPVCSGNLADIVNGRWGGPKRPRAGCVESAELSRRAPQKAVRDILAINVEADNLTQAIDCKGG